VGEGNFQKSTLLRKLNAWDYDAVPKELRKWVYAGGKMSKGLVNRRENEIKLWSGDWGKG
jgi:lysozyme